MFKKPKGLSDARPLHFFWLIDCSGSMRINGRIQLLNQALRESLEFMRQKAEDVPQARLLLQAIRFSDEAVWHIAQPTPIEDASWTDLSAEGITSMGSALALTASHLRIPPLEREAFPSALILMSDGQPTDDFEEGLKTLLKQPAGQAALRMAIAIGDEVDEESLRQFIGNPVIPLLKASTKETLIQAIHETITQALTTAASQPRQKPIPASPTREKQVLPIHRPRVITPIPFTPILGEDDEDEK